MKNIIIYSVIFIAAFAATTFGIYTLNNKYADVFKFDFRDRSSVEKMIAKSLVKVSTDSIAVAQNDSLVTDSLIKNKTVSKVKTIETFKDTIASVKAELNSAEQKLSIKDQEIKKLKSQLEEKENIKYQDWLKNTIKLYEEMESNKAAQLLQGIPENQARDIIYTMKKKKAAEILSYLEVGTVQRLTKAK